MIEEKKNIYYSVKIVGMLTLVTRN